MELSDYLLQHKVTSLILDCYTISRQYVAITKNSLTTVLSLLSQEDKKAILQKITDYKSNREFCNVWADVDKRYSDKSEVLRAEEVLDILSVELDDEASLARYSGRTHIDTRTDSGKRWDERSNK